MNSKSHWETVYETRPADAVSWYAPHLQRSLGYVLRAAQGKASPVIDIGGGESTLVDDLLAEGFSDLTVLDISAKALDVTRDRLGSAAEKVRWLTADLLDAPLEARRYEVWHDRAVFHFLTTEEQKRRYVARVRHSLMPGGFAIVATFGPEGPAQCSGLPVSRYAAPELHSTFGAPFRLVDSSTEVHTTPWGTPQQFVYCFCRHADQ
ncbi:MAG TPA: class I SAM-dependent methyltransferase [Caldimonas sp.]|jgi:SAM-dependent methyltransferase|nr:class I SAM-dependent methyltransferase [Caldimonas sp.]HEX2541134.1 class I SAM-dependent methyltransferase [Caldimonas sp.]